MWVFIDDSGDRGVKFSNGSSTHFVLSACVFKDRKSVNEANRTISALNVTVKDDGTCGRLCPEFKYAHTSDRIKDMFFRAIQPLDFQIRVIVVDKRILWSSRLTSNPKVLQHEMLKHLLTNTDGTVRNAALVIDGQDTKTFGLSDDSTLLSAVNTKCPGTLKSVAFGDSKTSPLIQLADMTAGAFRKASEVRNKKSIAHQQSIYFRTIRANGGSYWPFR